MHRGFPCPAGARTRPALAGQSAGAWATGSTMAASVGPRPQATWRSSTAARCPLSTRSPRRTSSGSAALRPVRDRHRRRRLRALRGRAHLVGDRPRSADRALAGGRAWYTVEPAALQERVRERTVAEMIEAARAAGAPVRGGRRTRVRAGARRSDPDARRPAHRPSGPRRRRRRPLRGRRRCRRDRYRGYSSGLAAALVFGRIAAETALA